MNLFPCNNDYKKTFCAGVCSAAGKNVAMNSIVCRAERSMNQYFIIINASCRGHAIGRVNKVQFTHSWNAKQCKFILKIPKGHFWRGKSIL